MHSTPPSADAAAPVAPSPNGAGVDRILPWVLSVGGLVGFLSALVLTVEKFALAADPDYIPSCSLNPVLSCGSVMSTPQASVFGFPNSLLGIAGFAIVTAIGVGLFAGARYARWFWMGLQVGVSAALVFVHWLIYQSLYVIGALCPYCMIVWAVTVPIFWYVTLRNLHGGILGRSIRTNVMSDGGNHLLPVTVWFLLVAALILHRFYSYWSTLL